MIILEKKSLMVGSSDFIVYDREKRQRSARTSAFSVFVKPLLESERNYEHDAAVS
jgi:hypothetical protein